MATNSKRIAAFDIGTVTCRLLLAEVQDGVLHELERRCVITNLGVGVDKMGVLQEDAIQRVVAQIGEYFGIFMLESRQAFMHSVGYGENGEPSNAIERHHAILPSPSQKIASFAIIDSRSLEVAFQDKKRTIAGEDRYLIPDGLLQCSMEASSKEVIDEITTIVEEVAEEYGANATVALTRAKAYVSEAAEEGRGVVPHELAAEVFEDEPLQERFVETAAEENIPERVRVDKKAAERITRNHKIRTDTGIEITFPSEYAHNPEFIEFASMPNGLISIELKNITQIENK